MSWINDPVNSPKHYTDSHPGMECIDLTADTTFCLGNCCKYLWRYHSKGRPLEDLEKARWYLCRVIDYGEKIAWTRQQYDILTALVAHTVGVEARTWANSSKATPTSPSPSSTNSSNGKETSNEHTHLLHHTRPQRLHRLPRPHAQHQPTKGNPMIHPELNMDTQPPEPKRHSPKTLHRHRHHHLHSARRARRPAGHRLHRAHLEPHARTTPHLRTAMSQKSYCDICPDHLIEHERNQQ